MCQHVQTLWISLEEYVMTYSWEEIDFDIRNVMFNKLIPQVGHIKNFLCLVTKQYIYRQCCLQEDCASVNYKALLCQ